MTPDDLRYTAEHEWVRVTGSDTVRVGITDYAQNQLGDVVFVQLPDVGEKIVAGQAFGDVESTKSTSDLVAPVSGQVVAANADLTDRPELVNAEPYAGGWMLDIRLDGPAEQAMAHLMDADGYRSVIA